MDKQSKYSPTELLVFNPASVEGQKVCYVPIVEVETDKVQDLTTHFKAEAVKDAQEQGQLEIDKLQQSGAKSTHLQIKLCKKPKKHKKQRRGNKNRQ